MVREVGVWSRAASLYTLLAQGILVCRGYGEGWDSYGGSGVMTTTVVTLL